MTKTSYSRELIGKEIEIVNSKNKANLGLSGKVIDETKNTLTIFCQGRNKILIKSNISFRLKGIDSVIEGERITRRPEERIKP